MKNLIYYPFGVHHHFQEIVGVQFDNFSRHREHIGNRPIVLEIKY